MERLEQTTIQSLQGVGKKRAELYARLGIHTAYSLLRFYPRSYIDFTAPLGIMEAPLEQPAVIRAEVYKKQPEQRIRKGLTLYRVYATDGVANMTITFFNNPYGYEQLAIGQTYLFYGKLTGNLTRREMGAPIFIPDAETPGMQPVYHLTEGLTSKMVMTNMREALSILQTAAVETLPADLLKEYGLCSFEYALQNIHFPQDAYTLSVAKKRLIFEELLTLQTGLLLLRQRNRKETRMRLRDPEISEFYAALPFALTGAQRRAIDDCLQDMQKNTSMNRLIQGDVGSGKTMVAAACCYACSKNRLQAAMMAPTEILALQHYDSLTHLLEPLGVRTALLTGSMPKSRKEKCKAEIAAGEYDLVVGTHAILQETTVFQNLALVVTDEQHRFGVAQRARLAQKGDNPHVLVMSATPIPRTLALIMYGDLDVSVMDELPQGRQKIETAAMSTDQRAKAYRFIRRQLDAGRQAYIVCPMIEDSETDLISVTAYAEELRKGEFASYSVGLLHGRMKPEEKEAIMGQFKAGKIQLLVATTVVEVGVDVPNATVMMLENAERFGLSQMHQLRGRVGRGSYKSYCILLSDHNSQENLARLQAMCQTSDGFKIAEEDLKLRGPGDFFGDRQHGLPKLKIADMMEDLSVLRTTQQAARALLQKDPLLEMPAHKGLRRMVGELFEEEKSGTFN